MNTISSTAVPGWPEPVREATSGPTELVSEFAALFSAVAIVPPPTPVVVVLPSSPARAGTEVPEATPRAEGEDPPTLPGGWPGVAPGGSPVFPVDMASGRPRFESPALAGVLADLTPARRDPGSPVLTEDAGARDHPSAGSTQPEAFAVASERLTGESVPELSSLWAKLRGANTPEIVAEVTAPVLAAMAVASNPAPAISRGRAGQAEATILARVVGGAGVPVPTSVVLPIASASGVGKGRNAGAEGTLGEAPVDDTAVAAGATVIEAAPAAAPAAAAAPAVVAAARVAEPKPSAAEPNEVNATDSAATDAAPVVVVPYGPPESPALAQAMGVTPRAVPAELPEPSAGSPSTPVQVPGERPQPAVPTHATVAFDAGDGQEGRLRVSLRGNSLRATLHLPDAAAAQRMEQDLAGLTRALRTQGFEEARLAIDAPRATTAAERSHDDSQPREHRNSRDSQPHGGERNARRERGTSHKER